MIRQLLRVPAYVCVATIIAQLIFLGSLIGKGNLGKNQFDEIAAIVYGVDHLSMGEFVAEFDDSEFIEPTNVSRLGDESMARRLDLDLRERAIQNGRVDLSYYATNLAQERERYNALRAAFELKMTQIGDTSTSQSVVELRRAIEVLTPAQAKDQILRLFASNQERSDDEIANDAVAIIRTLPIDKQKKIIAEFKNEDDKLRLHGILRLIRLGVPEVPLIRQAREQLEEFDPEATRNSSATVP